MVGGGLSYEALVLESDAPEYARRSTFRVQTGGRTYLTLTDATVPAGHHERPKGWDRYEAYIAHERASRMAALNLARSVYPELADVAEWPILWLQGLPVDRETHDVRIASMVRR